MTCKRCGRQRPARDFWVQGKRRQANGRLVNSQGRLVNRCKDCR